MANVVYHASDRADIVRPVTKVMTRYTPDSGSGLQDT